MLFRSQMLTIVAAFTLVSAAMSYELFAAAEEDKAKGACFCMSLAEACESCAAIEEAQQRGSEPFFESDPIRLTSPDRFSRAGEAYFSPDRKRNVIQAVPVEEETGDSPVSAM